MRTLTIGFLTAILVILSVGCGERRVTVKTPQAPKPAERASKKKSADAQLTPGQKIIKQVEEKVAKERKERRKRLGRAHYASGLPHGPVDIRKDVARENSWQPHVKIRALNACSTTVSIIDESGAVVSSLPPSGASISVLIRRDPFLDSNVKEIILQAVTEVDGKIYNLGQRRYTVSAWDAETRKRQPDIWNFCIVDGPPPPTPSVH